MDNQDVTFPNLKQVTADLDDFYRLTLRRKATIDSVIVRIPPWSTLDDARSCKFRAVLSVCQPIELGVDVPARDFEALVQWFVSDSC